jgi:hypothetical protein
LIEFAVRTGHSKHDIASRFAIPTAATGSRITLFDFGFAERRLSATAVQILDHDEFLQRLAEKKVCRCRSTSGDVRRTVTNRVLT